MMMIHHGLLLFVLVLAASTTALDGHAIGQSGNQKNNSNNNIDNNHNNNTNSTVKAWINDTTFVKNSTGTHHLTSMDFSNNTSNAALMEHKKILLQHAAQLPQHHSLNASIVESHSIADWSIHNNETMHRMEIRNETNTSMTHLEHRNGTADAPFESKLRHRKVHSMLEHTIELHNGKKNLTNSNNDGFKFTEEGKSKNTTIYQEVEENGVKTKALTDTSIIYMKPEVGRSGDEMATNGTNAFVQNNATDGTNGDEVINYSNSATVEPTTETEWILSNNTLEEKEYKGSPVGKLALETNSTIEEDVSKDNETVWETSPATTTTTMTTTTTTFPATTTTTIPTTTTTIPTTTIAPLLGEESPAVDAEIELNRYRSGQELGWGVIVAEVIDDFWFPRYTRGTASGAVNLKFVCSNGNGEPFFIVAADVKDKLPGETSFKTDYHRGKIIDLDHTYPSHTRVLVIQRGPTGPRKQKVAKIDVYFKGCNEQPNQMSHARKVTLIRTYEFLYMSLVPEEVIDLGKIESEEVELKSYHHKKEAERLHAKLSKRN